MHSKMTTQNTFKGGAGQKISVILRDSSTKKALNYCGQAEANLNLFRFILMVSSLDETSLANIKLTSIGIREWLNIKLDFNANLKWYVFSKSCLALDNEQPSDFQTCRWYCISASIQASGFSHDKPNISPTLSNRCLSSSMDKHWNYFTPSFVKSHSQGI